MDDLISRQAAIDALMVAVDDVGVLDAEDIETVFSLLPTAEPEIIRCKDCKHYQFADNRAFGIPVKMCERFGFEDVDDDDYCSRAERKTDG